MSNTVPVKGTVNVGNTVPVNGTVNIGNTVPVSGGVQLAPTTPITLEGSGFEGAPPAGQMDVPVTVPSGGRFVIESYSVLVRMPSGRQPLIQLYVTMNGTSHKHWVSQFYQQSDGGDDLFVATHDVRLYADPGSTITLRVSGNGTGLIAANITLSGYLI